MAGKSANSTATTMAGFLAALQKDQGESVGNFGGYVANVERIPTGIFEFDIALGGGFPRCKASMLWGSYSSCKTNLALCAIRQHQQLWPDLRCAFIDIEGSLDRKWALKIGVDMEKLMYLRPSFAEEAVDIIESLLYLEDCGLVVLDSIGSLIGANEIASSAEKAVVGGASSPTTKLARKSTLALMDAEKNGRAPSLLYINQMRHKIGVMYGSPESAPGGFSLQHQLNIWVRLHGKNVMDTKLHPTLPILKEVTFEIRKHKCSILSTTGRFAMVVVPHKGLQVGTSDDISEIKSRLEEFDAFSKVKGGYEILGELYPTQKAFEEHVYSNKEFGNDVRSAIITRLLQEANPE